MALQALALRGAPPIESQPEQPFPELSRPRKVIGRKLDQVDRHHPFSLCRLAPVCRYRRAVTTAAEILTSRFGYTEFRPGQQQVVESLLAGRSAVAVFPTGAGKSLCYQLPALMLEGVTVVVSPLIALMKDQIDLLARQGIDAARLDSSLDANEVRAVSDRLRAGSLKLLYVAPERFNNERFLAQLGQTKIALFAVDEAHCISEWGHNFRPDYLKLAARARELGAERVLALTATATAAVVADIRAGFEIEERDSVVTGFYRPNLTLLTTPVHARERDQALIDRLRERAPGPTIIYVTLQRTAERVAALLAAAGLPARAYHAGMNADERVEVQEWWTHSDANIVVATIAFGMVIDKADGVGRQGGGGGAVKAISAPARAASLGGVLAGGRGGASGRASTPTPCLARNASA